MRGAFFFLEHKKKDCMTAADNLKNCKNIVDKQK